MKLKDALEKLYSGNCRVKQDILDALQAAGNDLMCQDAPSKLSLSFIDKGIGDEGAEVFADVLASGHCPEGLELSLQFANSGIGDKGAQALARALKSGKCSPGLHLDLSYKLVQVKIMNLHQYF